MFDNLVEKFISYPMYLGQGAGKLAKIFKTDKETIYKAKQKAKDFLHNKEVVTLSEVISVQEDVIATLISEKVEGDDRKIELSSDKPMNREQIENLFSVDNISTRLSTYWNKQTASGKYIISANIKCLVQDFYTEEQFKTKLAQMYKDITPTTLVKSNMFDTGVAAFVYISDDHTGLSLNSSLFNNEWNKAIYRERMLKVAKRVLSIGFPVEHLFVVRLGDEADGWNGKTTRQDHSLGSLSNKEQFDMFTEVNKEFYDVIFNSGIANNYTVITCNNSNHSGLGLSYIYHKATEFYVQARYPEVMFLPINDFIGVIEWGNHVLGFTHGKDEKYMKAPFPLNLDLKTDLWLIDFYDNKGFSPNKRWISTMKGDIHKYNVNNGKSGRYVNIPSICGSSEWIEHNFGNTKAGALIEVVLKNDPDILSYPVRF